MVSWTLSLSPLIRSFQSGRSSLLATLSGSWRGSELRWAMSTRQWCRRTTGLSRRRRHRTLVAVRTEDRSTRVVRIGAWASFRLLRRETGSSVQSLKMSHHQNREESLNRRLPGRLRRSMRVEAQSGEKTKTNSQEAKSLQLGKSLPSPCPNAVKALQRTLNHLRTGD